VEESAAAAESLKDQAARLAEVVRVFRLKQEDASSSVMRPERARDPRALTTAFNPLAPGLSFARG
jgi:hypothetical protein